MSKAPTIFVGDSFYIFGGSNRLTGRSVPHHTYYTTIGKLSPNGQWAEVGELQRGRASGRVVFHEDYFLYVGGIDLAMIQTNSNSNMYLPTEKERFLLSDNT